MKKNINDIVEYNDKIIDISISQIVRNDFNPRQRFVDTEEETLIESIISKGLLNPIIVYKRLKDDRYVILDGERRFRAFTKLKKKNISCHVLEKEPTKLENFSIMFHIHNVREEWTDFSISQALATVIIEMGKDIKKLQRQDKLELSRITSLSEYKINKYLVFNYYPQTIINKFLASELKEKDQRAKGMDPDILAEMYVPIKKIEALFPDFIKKYPIKTIIDACIKKKAKKIVKANPEFRLLKKSLIATEKGNVRKEVMYEKLETFVTNIQVTPQTIFEETSESIYQVESIIKKTDSVIREIENLNVNQITAAEKNKLKNNLEILTSLLKTKLS